MNSTKGVCVHFTGKNTTICHAGVNYQEATNRSSNKRLPCVRSRERVIYSPSGDRIVKQVVVEHGECDKFAAESDTDVPSEHPSPELRQAAEAELRKQMEALKVEYVTSSVSGNRYRRLRCPICNSQINTRYKSYTGVLDAKCVTAGCLKLNVS